MSIAVEVFDSRRNQLGEGPTSSGDKNNHVQWCDIYGQAIRSKDLVTGQTGEYETSEPVGFQIPRTTGGDILGTANGPVLREIKMAPCTNCHHEKMLMALKIKMSCAGMMPRFHQMARYF